MSERAMVLVPSIGGEKKMVEVQNRHVNDVPGPGDEETVFLVPLDPKSFNDNTVVAATLARMVNHGWHYEMVRENICKTLGELVNILDDLKRTNSMTESSKLALFNYAIERLRDAGLMMVIPDD